MPRMTRNGRRWQALEDTCWYPVDLLRQDEWVERYDNSFRQIRRFLSQEGASEELADEYRDLESELVLEIDEITDNPVLAAAFAAQWFDHGGRPSKASFAMHALLTRHYMRGGYYPVGGSSVIAASMAPLIEAVDWQAWRESGLADRVDACHARGG